MESVGSLYSVVVAVPGVLAIFATKCTMDNSLWRSLEEKGSQVCSLGMADQPDAATLPPSSLHPWRSIGRRHARRGLRPFPDPGPETGVAQFKPILLKNSAADHLGGTKKVKSRSKRMIIARKEYSANYSCARLLPYFFQSAQPRLCEKYFGESKKF